MRYKVLFLLLISISCFYTQAQPHVFRSGDYIDVTYVNLELEVTDSNTYIIGKVRYEFRLKEQKTHVPFALTNNMELKSFKSCNKYILDAKHSGDTLLLKIDSTYNVNDILCFEAKYSGYAGPINWISGVFSEMDEETGVNVTWTLSEPYSSYIWFPSYQGLNDKIDSVSISVIVDKHLKAGAPGLLTKIDTLEDKLKYTWKHNYPTIYYLLSFCVGNFMDYSFKTTINGDSLLIQNYIYNDSAYLITNRKEIGKTIGLMKLYSDLYGTYPFVKEKYGHCNAPMGGGMENQSMTTIDHFSFNLIAHELAHQWFGNNVTCNNFQHIWLNEGFATYNEIVAIEHFYGKKAAIDSLNYLKQLILQNKTGSILVPENEIYNIKRVFNYTLSYAKGAWLVHMIRGYVNNDSIFFNSIKQFQQTYKYDFASPYDLLYIINENAKTDVVPFFNSWYKGEGYPLVSIKCRQRKKELHVDVHSINSSSEKEPFNIYLDLEIITKQGTNRLRKFVNTADSTFVIPVQGKVTKVRVDPANWILMNFSVELK